MAQADDRDQQIEALVRQYGQLIRRVVQRVGGQATSLVRDDIEQEVIVAIWQRLGREQPIEHPPSYIYRAALRQTVRVLRRQLAERSEPLAEGLMEPPAPAANNPDEMLEQRSRDLAVQQAIARLPEDRRRAVRAHLAGFRVHEVMNMYGWPYQRARNLIARGIADLRRLLKEEGIDGAV